MDYDFNFNHKHTHTHTHIYIYIYIWITSIIYIYIYIYLKPKLRENLIRLLNWSPNQIRSEEKRIEKTLLKALSIHVRLWRYDPIVSQGLIRRCCCKNWLNPLYLQHSCKFWFLTYVCIHVFQFGFYFTILVFENVLIHGQMPNGV